MPGDVSMSIPESLIHQLVPRPATFVRPSRPSRSSGGHPIRRPGGGKAARSSWARSRQIVLDCRQASTTGTVQCAEIRGVDRVPDGWSGNLSRHRTTVTWVSVNMQIHEFGHVVVKVRDRQRAEEFYSGVLGLPVAARCDKPPMTSSRSATTTTSPSWCSAKTALNLRPRRLVCCT